MTRHRHTPINWHTPTNSAHFVQRLTFLVFVMAAGCWTTDAFADEPPPTWGTPAPPSSATPTPTSRALPPPTVRKKREGVPFKLKPVVAPPNHPGTTAMPSGTTATPPTNFATPSPGTATGGTWEVVDPNRVQPRATPQWPETSSTNKPHEAPGTNQPPAEAMSEGRWSMPATGDGEPYVPPATPEADSWSEPSEGSETAPDEIWKPASRTSPRVPSNEQAPSGTTGRNTTESNATGSSRIVELTKRHNQTSPSGEPALVLHGVFEAVAERGNDLHVAAWFIDRETNNRLRSLRTPYADQSGHLTAQSRAVQVTDGLARYEFNLHVAYAAFPSSTRGASYDVDAWVQLYRHESDREVRVLAERKTSFRVFASATPAPADGDNDAKRARQDEAGPNYPVPEDSPSPEDIRWSSPQEREAPVAASPSRPLRTARPKAPRDPSTLPAPKVRRVTK